MKKIIFVLMILTMIAAGCASRQAVQAEKPEQKAAPQAQKKVEQAPAAAKAPSENVKEKQLAEAQLMKELQAKIKDIRFDFDRYSLRDDSKPAIKDVADILAKHRNLKVAIEGNCDERGTAEYNISLGERRAEAVKEYLIALGIPSGKIETTSYGKEKPICTDHNEGCWSKNRRAHMVLN